MQNRRRPESNWRQDLTGNNLKAVKIASNLYLSKIKAAERAYLAVRISEASNQQAELFSIVCNLSGIGHSDWPPSSISPDQLAGFFKAKVEAIAQDLTPYLKPVDQAKD